MSAACPTAIYQIPGPRGIPGINGANGEDGANAFSRVSAQAQAPTAGADVTVSVDQVEWAAPAGEVFVQNWGYYQIQVAPTSTTLTIRNNGTVGNAPAGTVLPVGSIIMPCGPEGAAGVISGTAGGDLKGTYPDPKILVGNTKGSLIVGNGTDSIALGVGTNGMRPKANSAQTTGLEYAKVNLADTAEVTGATAIGNGGTGQTTATAAFNALAPTTTRGDLITRDASNNVRKAVGAANTVLYSDGTDVQWGSVTSAMLSSGASGTLLQMKSSSTATMSTLTGVTPLDDTTPQNTEGTELLTVSITPTTTNSRLVVEAFVPLGGDSPGVIIGAIHRDSTADALAASAINGPAATIQATYVLSHEVISGSTSATTFKLRLGTPTGAGIVINGIHTGATPLRKFGGVSRAWIRVTEFAA